MNVKAIIAASILLAGPAWAAEEYGTGGSGAWTFAQGEAWPADVGSEQAPALGRFVYGTPSAWPADVGSAQVVMIDRTLSGHGLPSTGALVARAPAGSANRD